MIRSPDGSDRRDFLRQGLALGLAVAAGSLLRPAGLSAASIGPDPEVPNEQVAKILKGLFGDRPIRKGQVVLDMPVVAEDGRVVPVMIEAPDLAMAPGNYVKAVHLIVDHNPDPHLAAFELTPAMGRLSLQFRIKMKRTTWVRAIAETSSGDVWADYARVTVSLNGCG
jgi:sulfur-oxidizing protein SoxY